MVRKIRMKVVCLVALASLLVVLLPAQAPAKEWPKAITIAAGAPGGGVFTIGTGMASLITKYLKVKTNAESGLFGKNVVLLHNGDVDFGMAQSDLAYDAARGLGNYKQYGKMKLRLMFSGSVPPAAFVVKADSGIKTVTDLKGKTVMATMVNNSTFTLCGDLILKSAGMTRKDLKDIPFSGPKAGRDALAEGRVKSFIVLVPTVGKTAWVEELNMQIPIRFITGEEKALEAIIAESPFARKATLYAKYYGEIVNNKDLVSIGTTHNFLCRPALPDDLVYEVMKVFYGHLEELYAFHLEAKPYLANPLDVAVLPYHPGAIKYYKEKGLWTSKLEETQKKLLKELGASR
jgi:TRAP transporter TAXI family solute receptor